MIVEIVFVVMRDVHNLSDVMLRKAVEVIIQVAHLNLERRILRTNLARDANNEGVIYV